MSCQLEKLKEKMSQLHQKSNRCEIEQEDAIRKEMQKLNSIQEKSIVKSSLTVNYAKTISKFKSNSKNAYEQIRIYNQWFGLEP